MPTKAEELAHLDAAYRKLTAALDTLTPAQHDETWLGTWSVKELLAHISGWHEEMTAGLQRMARGERPTPEGVDYSDFDRWNATFAERAAGSFAGERARLDRSFAAFRAAAEAVPGERFGEGKTVNTLLAGTGAHHYEEHLAELQSWLKGG